jgi:hypothetical protein
MKKQHEHGNLYNVPEEEKIPGEEARESFDDLCRSALLLSDAEFVSRKHFVQDVGAYTAPEWKVNRRVGG